MSYDALLLDHDGVVVTLGDRAVHDEAAHTALRQSGIADPDPDAVETLRMHVSDDDLARISGRYDLDPDALWQSRDDVLAQALRDETRAGRKAPYDDVDVLEDIDHPLGIVSNNQSRIVEFVLDHYDLARHVDTIHARSPTPDSLARKKPATTYLDAAMADLAVENPLFVGDSESDVVAGQRAGLDTAFLRRPHNAEQTLSVDPTYELSGLAGVRDVLQNGHGLTE